MSDLIAEAAARHAKLVANFKFKQASINYIKEACVNALMLAMREGTLVEGRTITASLSLVYLSDYEKNYARRADYQSVLEPGWISCGGIHFAFFEKTLTANDIEVYNKALSSSPLPTPTQTAWQRFKSWIKSFF